MDSDGVAKITVIGKFQVNNLNFYACLAEDSNVKTYFNVTFRRPNWLFLVWMCANNKPCQEDLEPFGLSNLEIMKNANLNVSVVVFWDGREKDPVDKTLFLDEYGNWKTFYSFDGDLNTGSYSKLREELIRVFNNLESTYRALIFWDHGRA